MEEVISKRERIRMRLTVPVFGLGCGGGGALALERTLGRVPGVVYVYVNPATEMVYAEYDSALTGPDQVVAAIGVAGFRAGSTSLR